MTPIGPMAGYGVGVGDWSSRIQTISDDNVL